MILRGDRVELQRGVAGRLSHTYENPFHRHGTEDRAAVTVWRKADPPHPQFGPRWPEQWSTDYTSLQSLEIVRIP